MAILEKIRKRTFFLILIIGLALFAFVISGIFTRGNQTAPTNIGVVNGEDIPYASFHNQVDNTIRNMGGNPNISSMYIVNMLWQQAVQGKILDQQFEKLGISVGRDQILAAVAQSPAIAQDPQFQNQNGVFDPNKFTQFISTLKNTNPAAYNQWLAQEGALAESAKRSTYLSLVRAGLGATATEGELSYHQEADKVNINYLALPYSSIADSLIKISDSQIKDYINKNKKEFEQEALRNVQFVFIPEQASEADSQAVKQALEELKKSSVVYNKETGNNDTLPGFASVLRKDIADFVDRNSDVPFDSLYLTKDKLPAAFADMLYDLPVGAVSELYKDGNNWSVSRMLSKLNNAEVRASHILVAYKGSMRAAESVTRTKEEAKQKAEGLLQQVRQGADFAKLADENSDDSSTSGGDLNFFQRGRMVKPFNDYVFSHKVGDVGLVETDFGYHIIKITEEKPGVQLATLTRKIEPSDVTRNEIFTKASGFEIQAIKDPAKFVDIANNESLSVLPADNLQETTENIPGLGENRQLVRWAFDKETKIGDVSRFDVKNGYVIAQLTRKSDKGLMSVADARIIVQPILVKQEKAKQLSQKMKGSTLSEIANNANLPNIRTADGLTLKSPVLTGEGREPNVVGAAFALPLNKISEPIEGENGVYVIEVTQKNIAPALPNYASYANALRMLKVNRASTELFSALEENADIEDNRSLFY